ncbi:hypothetical protein KRP22_006341 [Phytophthora ramorum]|nr:hypothetical protein KRP22_2526 [Phytophthora ramorum]
MSRKQYSDAALVRAVERVVVNGERATLVGEEQHIPYRTLLMYVARRRRGEPIASKRRGPPPALTQAGEQQLLHWMHELQAAGLPVRRRELIVKANEVLSLSGSGTQVSSGWYTRFRDRHPEISGPGTHMVIAEEAEEKEEKEEVRVEGKTREQLEREGLLRTPVEKAVFSVQESYADSWPAQDVVDAFDLMLDAGKADMFLVMAPGDLRDMWIRKQLKQMQRASTARH